ncbi:MAG: copper-binding protein [Acetobacteraceae bacterium]|nr:copper-binding protein [Acetobacteraceae bacterium]
MSPVICRPLVLASVILIALPACAASPPAPAAPAAVDLGPSSRVAATRIALAGGTPGPNRAATVQLVHDGVSDTHATATVNTVDPAQRKINLSHEPIPSIGWPAMTMDFAVAPSVDLSRVKPGARVDFSIQKGKAGMYEVQSVQPAGAKR